MSPFTTETCYPDGRLAKLKASTMEGTVLLGTYSAGGFAFPDHGRHGLMNALFAILLLIKYLMV